MTNDKDATDGDNNNVLSEVISDHSEMSLMSNMTYVSDSDSNEFDFHTERNVLPGVSKSCFIFI